MGIAIADAAIEPKKYEALKNDVRVARSLGWPSSPIREEAETIHITMPKPRTILAKMYIPTREGLVSIWISPLEMATHDFVQNLAEPHQQPWSKTHT